MRRLAAIALGLLAIGSEPAHAATKTYSTGNINAAVGATLDQALNVPDRGPVSFVRVSFRITVPDTSALAISLVSPQGTVLPLVVNRGADANFGSGEKGCGGLVTVLDSDTTSNPIASGSAPFTDGPYRAEGNLRRLYDEDARGRWRLRIANSGGAATLHCLTLDISRAVPQRLTAERGPVRASVTFQERDFLFEKLRVKVERGGRTVVDAPIQRLRCPDCGQNRPVSVRIRDLDGGEPEVLVDMYTGGAHCCSNLLVLRYDAAARTYRPTLLDFGNYGYRIVDLDHDGLPELSAFDERFLYTFTAYVFSAAPPRISQYRQGKLLDVTRRFPGEIRNSAKVLAKTVFKLPPETDVDARAYVAAYVADQYLLGRPEEARRTLDFALAHGKLYSGKEHLGTPAGRSFLAVLDKLLRQWGYVTA
jgi:subtilisin-like proprotein convertase family protein